MPISCKLLGAMLLVPAFATFQARAGEVKQVAQAIDKEIQRVLVEKKAKSAPAADDAEFLRRACLDITGRIPSAERAAEFLASSDPDKRSKLIDELLANAWHGEYFAGMWTDMFNATGTPPRSLAGSFRKWLADEFNKGVGWDKIVHGMLTAEGLDPASYFVRANFKEPGQLAGTTGRFFLGVRMECAECHDHPFVDWKQTDYWGLAVFFSRLKQVNAKGGNVLTEDPLPGKKPKAAGQGGSIVIPSEGGNRGAGKVVKAKFLSGAEPKLPDEGALRPTLAAWLTAKDNPFFARAAVNRLWAHFFGSGILNPIDDFNDNSYPSHPELLDLLSREFVDSGHNLKHLIRCLCLSDTYQRTSKLPPTVAGAANKDQPEDDPATFSRMAVKVMNADVLFDSLVTALGNPKLPGGLGSPLPYEVYSGGAIKGAKIAAREEFIKFFDTKDDSGKTTEYTHGIPQVLALMNAAQFHGVPPLVEKLVQAKLDRDKALDTLFLATLTRYPTPRERTLMTQYLERRPDPRQGYAGVLWILFNTNEFVVNH